MAALKVLKFRGSALRDLKKFPNRPRKEAGFQLAAIQAGAEPSDWKPISAIGAGVRELRIRDVNGAYRVIYIASFATAIYVLHCFQKKSEKTAQSDINLASQRFQDLLKELRQ